MATRSGCSSRHDTTDWRRSSLRWLHRSFVQRRAKSALCSQSIPLRDLHAAYAVTIEWQRLMKAITLTLRYSCFGGFLHAKLIEVGLVAELSKIKMACLGTNDTLSPSFELSGPCVIGIWSARIT